MFVSLIKNERGKRVTEMNRISSKKRVGLRNENFAKKRVGV